MRYVYRDGEVIPKALDTVIQEKHQIAVKESDTRIRCVQLPRNYKYAKRFDKDGTVIATSHKEARELAAKARDHGEGVWYDR